ncbi:cell envelope biogenesis protein TolA [Sphingosinicella sp. LHD-64]|uniref:cell envelope biogenesis protein TolA n=1 Tax=Sphingosinicella sp. LHD-64 TaxID=3072139 RepID=UPI0028106CDF|nr:cell envelope biogenesis protein TolA [Sphingosinicella sp. LHD-64]MDQ8755880.1 cell envelope biogenesis protein TolA [Sphingosinicella sp. LHD-64]
MERAEATGLGVAVVGHAALLAALTFGLFAAGSPPPISDAVEVSFVDEVALESASPTPAAEPPAAASAPDLGPAEEAAPAPAPPAPAPTPREASPSPQRAQPKQRTAQTDPRDRRRPEEARNRDGHRSRAPRLADLDLSNLGRDPSRARTQNAAPAATMSAAAAASIGQAIQRQIQPCADRQVYPGPGAERIVTQVNLRLNRDGSLAARPRVGRQSGVDDENRRYADRVADLAIAAFTGCSPLRGLPQELYDVPRGWSNFTMNYRLPG